MPVTRSQTSRQEKNQDVRSSPPPQTNSPIKMMTLKEKKIRKIELIVPPKSDTKSQRVNFFLSEVQTVGVDFIHIHPKEIAFLDQVRRKNYLTEMHEHNVQCESENHYGLITEARQTYRVDGTRPCAFLLASPDSIIFKKTAAFAAASSLSKRLEIASAHKNNSLDWNTVC